jgi:glucose/arabinose dehydrogenase
MKRAGAGVPSPNRITLLRDADGDGVAEVRRCFMTNLMSPFGMALVGNELLRRECRCAREAALHRGETIGEGQPTLVKVTDLPAGINHHWTKNLIASPTAPSST